MEKASIAGETGARSSFDSPAELRQHLRSLEQALLRVIRGSGEPVHMALVALLSRGHLLIEDVPGVGKTTLAHALARSLNEQFPPSGAKFQAIRAACDSHELGRSGNPPASDASALWFSRWFPPVPRPVAPRPVAPRRLPRALLPRLLALLRLALPPRALALLPRARLPRLALPRPRGSP